ncbi:hypothetical protein CEXT_357611 [Caerostris extrusa]|uniref:Uncharacterized protein n=1 Tax=Caerostris extrusa TaxID=172846 RepID=A0AAV4NRT6_CAEEX|nr:hypothetical protein CEXT_357611 [Caerostris extrusa]
MQTGPRSSRSDTNDLFHAWPRVRKRLYNSEEVSKFSINEIGYGIFLNYSIQRSGSPIPVVVITYLFSSVSMSARGVVLALSPILSFDKNAFRS